MWFLTLFSLILVLSVYYITMPNELLLANNSNYNKTEPVINEQEEDEVKVTIEESEEVVALRTTHTEEVLKEISSLQEMMIQEDKTAEEKNDAYEKIRLLTSLQGQEEKLEDARKIMAVRYEATIGGFSNIKPITISKDISRSSANQIKEQSDKFPGTSLVTEPVIEYPYKNLASHLLGYLGRINSEEYKNNKDKYQMNDLIGREGNQ